MLRTHFPPSLEIWSIKCRRSSAHQIWPNHDRDPEEGVEVMTTYSRLGSRFGQQQSLTRKWEMQRRTNLKANVYHLQEKSHREKAEVASS